MKKPFSLARHLGPFLLLPVLSSPLLIVGCATQPEQSDAPEQKVQLTASAQTILAARKLTSPALEQKLLTAVPLLIQEGNLTGAENLLAGLKLQGLPPPLKAEIGIANAEIALLKGHFQSVLDILAAHRFGIANQLSSLSLALQNKVSLMRADALEQLGDPLAAANERIFVSPMLPEGALADNNERIWNDLVQFPAETLQQLSETTNTPDLKGWLTLIAAYKNHQDDIDTQLDAVDSWLRQNVTHPANRAVPKAIAMLKALASYRPQKIALLLPQSGPYRPAAEAIEQGFMAAYFHTQESRQDKARTPSVKIYEEGNSATFDSAYQQAIADGAELVIGPLTKDNVRRLYQFKETLPVPTLALNSSDLVISAPDKLYQFGLSPEDDARESALHAAARGYNNAAILSQDTGEWSQRVQRAFTQQWEALGKRVIAQASYKNGAEMENAIKSLLRLEDSTRRAQQVSRVIGENVVAEPRPRADLDFVFLITPGDQARQVKPLFDFHYATDTPLLGGSYLYSGVAAPENNQDMEGIAFCDIPWILQSPSATHIAFDRAWPNAEPRMARFNALGVDAYRLADRLQAMEKIPESKLYGATGIIQLDPQGRLNRALSWAQFREGYAQPLLQVSSLAIENGAETTPSDSEEGDSEQGISEQSPPEQNDREKNSIEAPAR